VTDEDHQMENSDLGLEKQVQDTVLEDILSLN
jgi:hypothetical protein